MIYVVLEHDNRTRDDSWEEEERNRKIRFWAWVFAFVAIPVGAGIIIFQWSTNLFWGMGILGFGIIVGLLLYYTEDKNKEKKKPYKINSK